MDVHHLWIEEFIAEIEACCSTIETATETSFNVIGFNDKLFINFVSLNAHINAEQLIELQTRYHKEQKTLIHLWEDVWSNKRTQVLSRIYSFLSLNKIIYARSVQIKEVKETNSVKSFLEENHLQGYVKTAYNYGLYYKDILISVACFGAEKLMKSRGENYYSSELVRFATQEGYTVTGGLSKLIRYFLEEAKVNDIMTYADRDWSVGNGYEKLGFNKMLYTPPLYMLVDLSTGKRYLEDKLPKSITAKFLNINKEEELKAQLLQNDFVRVFNTGNIKYILYNG
ncbi:hypothetical protein [Pedobacter montanisoli]|uniref:N-acetyltransferase domain-containing protein n=1 Tax=Pedobacter montanisoli TaxID=2923277 RepID=A0ABS9ZY02_9SPHI|nr:hypothetical protein [Pedobacter montanisoli]MCJ0743191.1 hypothetical protein [Pedobacter montanisoli]